MRTVTVAVLLVLALASVAGAQVTFTPSADVGFLTLKQVDSDDETTKETSVTAVGVGVTADVGHGVVVAGSFGYGFGGDVKEGATIEVDDHTVTTLGLSARYTAYETDAFAIGPVVDYQSANWKYEEGGNEVSTKTSGLGVGVFATADLAPVVVSASYIHRLNAKQVEKVGATETETEGNGSLVAIGATYPLSDTLSLNGAYEIDTQYSDDDGKQISSGFKLGANFAF